MRYIACLVGIIGLMVNVACAADDTGRLNLGLNMGVLNPDGDQWIEQRYDKNFQLQGNIGIQTAGGLEFRGSLGSYSDYSRDPSDNETEVKFGMTMLTASLIYNVPVGLWGSSIFAGGGVGAYFYNLSDIDFPDLANGTAFGFHALAGIRLHLTPDFYVNAQYEKHFIPPMIFDSAKNFDSSVLTLGAGISIPINPSSPQMQGPAAVSSQPAYKYTKEQEELLVEMEQLNGEIKEMQEKRKQLEDEIDAFYYDEDYNENDKEFDQKYKKVKFMERRVKSIDLQITKAQNRLDVLKVQWNNIKPDDTPVQEQIIYLKRNYVYSPHRLYYRGGYLMYSPRPYVHRYYTHNESNDSNVSNSGSSSSQDTQTSGQNAKKDYVQKKHERLEEIKNRPLR